MKKILAFAGSNSSNSINQQLAVWAANQLTEVEIIEVHLNDFEMPLYSMEREQADGLPQLAKDFKALVDDADGIIVSFAEHNGTFSVAFKNIYDWISRVSSPIWGDIPMMIMCAAPGPRGGVSVLKTAQEILPFRGAKISGVFSLPLFNKNFDGGVTNPELLENFKDQLAIFEKALEAELETTV